MFGLKGLIAAAGFALAGMLAGTAQAAPVTYNFSGTVFQAGAGVGFGDPFSGSFTFDDTTPDGNPGNTSTGTYSGGSFSLSMGAINFTSGLSLVVVNDTGGQDALSVNAVGASGGQSMGGGFFFGAAALQFTDTDETAFDSDAISELLTLSLSDFDTLVPFNFARRLEISLATTPGGPTSALVLGEVTSITVASGGDLPEPSAVLLLGGGLVGLALWRRRRRAA